MRDLVQIIYQAVTVALGARKPIAASLIVTERCCWQCAYCGNSDPEGYHATTDELLTLIRKLAQAGTQRLLLTGGEPLLRKDLGDLVRFASEQGMQVTLNTSGYHLDQHLDEIRELAAITISLDGPEAFNDQARGAGNYQAAVAAIRMAQEKKIPVSIAAVVRKGTAEHVDEFLDLAGQLNVKVYFQPMFLQTEEGRALTLDREERHAFFSSLRKRKGERKEIGNSEYSLIYFSGQRPMPRCFGGRAFCRIEPPERLTICGDYRGSCATLDPDASIRSSMQSLDPSGCTECNCLSHVLLNGALSYHPQAIAELLSLL